MPEIQYILKRNRRARRIIVSVHASGEIVVTMPHHFAPERAEVFVQSRLPWILKTQAKMQKRFEGKTPLKQTRKEYKALKEKALDFVIGRLEHFNKHYKYSYKRVSIRMQKTRWGSCSKTGNLNFNYSLIKLPQELADYIVVHELCHLKQFNHSERFWDLVAETIPNHRELRKTLKEKFIHVS